MKKWVFLYLLLLSSCQEKNEVVEYQKVFELQKENDTLHYLKLQGESLQKSWELPYVVFHLDEGDVNNDGSIDALVGVIKSTHYDKIKRKRLFIFKNHSGYIRPLWLGSRLSHPLVDFRFLKGNEGGFIFTLERSSGGEFFVQYYKWRGFGLDYVDGKSVS